VSGPPDGAVHRPVTGATKVTGIIGDPVAHSRSPAIWNAAFDATGLDWMFVAFPVRSGQGSAALDGMRALGIAGLSVTMPHKSDAAKACDELTPTADALQAVNAVANVDGRLLGSSTDGEGFIRSLHDEDVDPSGKRVLIVGAGGAARAIAHALGGLGATVSVAARRPDAAARAAELAPGGEAVAWGDLETRLADADMIVNATPIGMGGEPPTFDVDLVTPDHVVVDTVYHPAATPLLASARARGARSIGGLGMLVHQAAITFESFTGHDAPLAVMRAAADASE
jgi:shikimate dehydrogenase